MRVSCRPIAVILLSQNISITNNYRSQFDRVISKSSFDELKKMLKEKAK
jgi:ABC-type transporter MlaC component